jgi:hypothetical protein
VNYGPPLGTYIRNKPFSALDSGGSQKRRDFITEHEKAGNSLAASLDDNVKIQPHTI